MRENFTSRLEKKLKKTKSGAKHNKDGYGIGLKISMDLVSSIIAGVLIGLGIDKIFSTKPIFFIVFLLLGVITGFYSLFKSIKKLN